MHFALKTFAFLLPLKWKWGRQENMTSFIYCSFFSNVHLRYLNVFDNQIISSWKYHLQQIWDRTVYFLTVTNSGVGWCWDYLTRGETEVGHLWSIAAQYSSTLSGAGSETWISWSFSDISVITRPRYPLRVNLEIIERHQIRYFDFRPNLNTTIFYKSI